MCSKTTIMPPGQKNNTDTTENWPGCELQSKSCSSTPPKIRYSQKRITKRYAPSPTFDSSLLQLLYHASSWVVECTVGGGIIPTTAYRLGGGPCHNGSELHTQWGCLARIQSCARRCFRRPSIASDCCDSVRFSPTRRSTTVTTTGSTSYSIMVSHIFFVQ
jgi:hypothetical protein